MKYIDIKIKNGTVVFNNNITFNIEWMGIITIIYYITKKDYINCASYIDNILRYIDTEYQDPYLQLQNLLIDEYIQK